MALLKFTHAYRTAGITLAGGELPDHLALVCEVAARAPDTGLLLLADNRAGVELLRMATPRSAPTCRPAQAAGHRTSLGSR